MRLLNDIYKLFKHRGNRRLVTRSANLIIKVTLNYLLNKLKKVASVFLTKSSTTVYQWHRQESCIWRMTTKSIYNVTTIKSKDLRIICYPLVNDDSIAKIAWFPFLEIWNQDGMISLRTNTSGISLNIKCCKIWFLLLVFCLPYQVINIKFIILCIFLFTKHFTLPRCTQWKKESVFSFKYMHLKMIQRTHMEVFPILYILKNTYME